MADSVLKQIEDQMITDIEANLTNSPNAIAGPIEDARGLAIFIKLQGGGIIGQSYGAIDKQSFALLTVVSKDIEKVRLALQELLTLWMPVGAASPLENLVDLNAFVKQVTQTQEPVEWSSNAPREGRIELELEIRYSFG